MTKLAKCRLCGIEPERHYDTDFDPPLLSVGCELCCMGTPHLRQSSAEKIWNDHMAKKDASRGWISVKDRLPEPWETVLLWGHGEAVSGYLADNGLFVDHRWGQFFTATHWMIPEPPKEEEVPHNRYYSGDGIASDRT